MTRRDERGAGTVLTAGVCWALMVVAWCSSVLVAWLGQISASQDAADLSALAAAGAMARGANPCSAADEVAARNGAEMIDCTVSGDRWAFVVEIRVSQALEPTLPGAPGEVEAGASAGSLQ